MDFIPLTVVNCFYCEHLFTIFTINFLNSRFVWYGSSNITVGGMTPKSVYRPGEAWRSYSSLQNKISDHRPVWIFQWHETNLTEGERYQRARGSHSGQRRAETDLSCLQEPRGSPKAEFARFENYTNDQMFFMSSAKLWCS